MPTISNIPPSKSRSIRNATNHHETNVTSTTTTANSASAVRSEETILSLSPSRLPVKPKRSSPRPRSSTTENLSQSRLVRSGGAISTATNPSRTTDLQKKTTNARFKSSSGLEVDRKDRSRPPLTAANSQHLRDSSTSSSSAHTRDLYHGRSRSSTALHNSSISRSSAQVPLATNLEHVTLSVPEALPKKPNFSTLQKHYSPAKNLAPKLHTSAFLAPSSPSKWPVNKAISAETAKLQNELLQLHLLHKDAGRAEKEWRISAKRKLCGRFQSIVEKKHIFMQQESLRNAELSAISLKKWQDVGLPGWGVNEKIQVLDEIITGILNIEEAGGKYTRVVRTFHNWVETCQGILDSRAKEETDQDDFAFVERLESSWKYDCYSLGRKLEMWKDKARDLGVPGDQSGLSILIKQIERFVTEMLTELSLMTQIEEEVINIEYDWIQHSNDEIISEECKDSQIAGAIWRSI